MGMAVLTVEAASVAHQLVNGQSTGSGAQW